MGERFLVRNLYGKEQIKYPYGGNAKLRGSKLVTKQLVTYSARNYAY